MYKKGDKFVIEIGDEYKSESGNVLYRIKGFNSLVFDKGGLDRLKEFNLSKIQEDMKDARDDGMRVGYAEGFKEGYGKAMLEAKMFIDGDIEIGDEVENTQAATEGGQNAFVVTSIDKEHDFVGGLTEDGEFIGGHIDYMRKTGRTFNIRGLLDEMKGDDPFG